jgi:hypothetical protein
MEREITVGLTDQQVATLRAQLRGDFDQHRELLRQLRDADALEGYMTLVEAAFFEAVDRRFKDGGTRADVIEFVGSVRARFPGADAEIDPDAAERLVCKVLGEGSIAGIDGATIRSIELLLLPILVSEEQLDDDGLNGFLNASRKLADR